MDRTQTQSMERKGSPAVGSPPSASLLSSMAPSMSSRLAARICLRRSEACRRLPPRSLFVKDQLYRGRRRDHNFQVRVSGLLDVTLPRTHREAGRVVLSRARRGQPTCACLSRRGASPSEYNTHAYTHFHSILRTTAVPLDKFAWAVVRFLGSGGRWAKALASILRRRQCT